MLAGASQMYYRQHAALLHASKLHAGQTPPSQA